MVSGPQHDCNSRRMTHFHFHLNVIILAVIGVVSGEPAFLPSFMFLLLDESEVSYRYDFRKYRYSVLQYLLPMSTDESGRSALRASAAGTDHAVNTENSGRVARVLMIQGCGSDVGKSLIVTGLCRAAARRGYRVAPFKAQNMSNNAAVVSAVAFNGDQNANRDADQRDHSRMSGEIGRAQALQAVAAKIAPTVDMNPVLLKPQSDTTCQVIVHGNVVKTMSAQDYFGSDNSKRPPLLIPILESFTRLCNSYDLVICEGAGSPAEVNLRSRDIANMGFVLATGGIPVVLVGDIDKGGVIASLVGTKMVLDPTDAAYICGCIVNKFRGDVSLFTDGVTAIEEMTSWSCLGVVPWLSCASRLPAEDAVSIADASVTQCGAQTDPQSNTQIPLRIAAPMLSRLSNFDDVDPLRILETERVQFSWVPPGKPIPIKEVDVILLLGTKSTLVEWDFVQAQGWDVDILAHARQRGRVLGVCGGYQMLGRTISDPDGVDGTVGNRRGLGLLNVDTVLKGTKTVQAVTGTCVLSHCSVTGYEIHTGQTTGIDATERPMVRLSSCGNDGARSLCGRIEGCYVHGLFGDDEFRRNWIDRACGLTEVAQNGTTGTNGYAATVELALDELADGLESSLDLDALFALARPAGWKPTQC